MTQPLHLPHSDPRGATRRKRRSALLGLLVLGLATGLVAPSYGDTAPRSAARSADPVSAPTFAAPYLNGVSGPLPTRTVGLDGQWDFTPIKNTVCTGGGRFGTTTGPMTCVDSPASQKKTTIQVPGGGWHKQGYTDLSVAEYSRKIRVPKISGGQVTKLTFGAINHEATLWVDGHEVGTQTTSYTSSVFDISAFVRPGATHEIKVLVHGRKALVGPDGRYNVAEGASWSDDVAQGIFHPPTSRSSPPSTSPTPSYGPRWPTES